MKIPGTAVIVIVAFMTIECMASDRHGEAINIAELWVSRMDMNLYDMCWNDLSENYKETTEMTEWSESMEAKRGGLGANIERDLLTVVYKTSAEKEYLDPGDYVEITYWSSFVNHSQVYEIVVIDLSKTPLKVASYDFRF